jgi:hypothetical protein
MRSVGILSILLAGAATAAAQDSGNWRMPGPIQQPGAIQKPGNIQQPASVWGQPGEIQKAGEIQVPKGPWLQPGEIQKAGEIQQPKGPGSFRAKFRSPRARGSSPVKSRCRRASRP